MCKTAFVTPETLEQTGLFHKEAVCAIGAFDGVHLGHQYLISNMLEDAQRRGCSSVIVTFDIDPDELFLSRDKVQKITSNPMRLELLQELGAEYLYVIPFTKELAALSCQEFLEHYLFQKLSLACIHVGQDFKMGAGAASGIQQIDEICKPHTCSCIGYDLRCDAGKPITSTRIRALIAQGHVEEAEKLLGRPYFVGGTVVHGRGEGGAKFGIPTANVEQDCAYAPLKDGVYAGYVAFDGMAYPAAINVGIPPTFSDVTQATLEPHIIDFQENLYNCYVHVSFIKRLRDTKIFENSEELIATIKENIAWTRDNLAMRTGRW